MDTHNRFIKKLKIAYKQIERLKVVDHFLADSLKYPSTEDINAIEKVVIFKL